MKRLNTKALIYTLAILMTILAMCFGSIIIILLGGM